MDSENDEQNEKETIFYRLLPNSKSIEIENYFSLQEFLTLAIEHIVMLETSKQYVLGGKIERERERNRKKTEKKKHLRICIDFQHVQKAS